VNALELFMLGRKLAKLGVEALPSATVNALPPSAKAVLIDVIEYPGTAIGEIARRTELPQSQVSVAVATLREHCLIETELDPADRRRTLVREAPGMADILRPKVAVPIDETIVRALCGASDAEFAEVVAALELLAERFTPRVVSWSRVNEGAASA
jgi:DNA-binding MarR family transcriptional regulator